MFIIGHRGAAARAPENTLRALKEGMKCAHFVEVDVRMSQDGVPVILHDSTLNRTTNGTGEVKGRTLAELKRLDAGEGESIPTLEEVLSLVNGRCGLIVELKEQEGVGSILNSIGSSGVHPIFIVSFHSSALKHVHQLLPRAGCGLIVSRWENHPLEQATILHANWILPKISLLTPERVEEAHQRHLQVVPWTLNHEREIRAAVEAQADGFATDDPCFARRILKELD